MHNQGCDRRRLGGLDKAAGVDECHTAREPGSEYTSASYGQVPSSNPSLITKEVELLQGAVGHIREE